MVARQGTDYWQAQVEDWRQSGLSQIAYCKQRDLNIKSFRRWRTKLQRAATPALTLVPVSVSAQIPEPPIRLHSPGGWRIELPAANAAWLADLVRGLP